VPEGRDITERKDHEQKYRQIVRRMKEAIIEIDADWRITLVNERVEAFTGLDEAEFLGSDFWDVFEAARGTPFEDAYRAAMDEREEASVVGYYPAVDEWFDVDVYPNDDGGLACYFLSITDHKERERELERTRDFFEQAERLGNLGAWEFDAAGDLTWTDGTRRIHEVDDAYEPTLEEALEFFDPDDRDRLEAAVEAAIDGERPTTSRPD
jgi:PAS domain S-box-containing protein